MCACVAPGGITRSKCQKKKTRRTLCGVCAVLCKRVRAAVKLINENISVTVVALKCGVGYAAKVEGVGSANKSHLRVLARYSGVSRNGERQCRYAGSSVRGEPQWWVVAVRVRTSVRPGVWNRPHYRSIVWTMIDVTYG